MKINVVETIIDVFKDVNWNPLTITMPQNGDVVTIIPEFYKTKSGIRNENTLKGLTVTGACMPISGPITYVVKQLRNYDSLIALRTNINSQYQTKVIPTAIPAPAFV